MSGAGQDSLPARSLSWSPRSAIRRYGVYGSLALLLLIALVVRPEVYRPESLFLILRSASQLGMVALGQTLVMLVAGLDLSVTGLLVLTSVVIAQVGAGQDSRILPGLLIALCFGALIGLTNGLLITKRNVPPFVATLGMLVLIRGAQSVYTQGIPSGQVPDGLKVLNQSLGPLPVSFVIWAAFTALLAFLLYATPFGRRIYAIGSNHEAARLSGIAVDRYVVAVYVLCSLLVVGSGIILSGYVGYVDRYLGRGFDLELDCSGGRRRGRLLWGTRQRRRGNGRRPAGGIPEQPLADRGHECADPIDRQGSGRHRRGRAVQSRGAPVMNFRQQRHMPCTVHHRRRK